MITILRKIRQNLLGQNRYTRYFLYALGEIFLVVIGILIALQINNWNQDAQDRKKESKVLSDLKHEFEENRLRLHETIQVKREALHNTRNLLKMMKRDYISMNEIKPAIVHTFGIYTYNPSGGIINTIISTGNIDLIRDEELKFALSQWQDVLLDYQEEETAHQTWYIQIMEPYLNQHLPKKYKGDGNEDYLFHTEAELEALYNQAFNDMEFQNLYISNERYLDRTVNAVTPVSENIDVILKRIDTHLDKEKYK